MKEVLDNLILKVRVGSHLYGTNTPESDEDFVGIFVPPAEYLLGLKNIEEVDLSVKDKDAAGKNTSEAIDFKAFTLKKFARLALDNNPNILEILFVNPENILFINEVGRKLLDMRYAFISKNIKHRFLGYAFSQKHKMVIKLENYEKLNEALKYLGQCNEKFLLEIEHHPLFIRKKDHMRIADINVPLTATVKKAKQSIQNRLNTFGSRQKLVSKYGYDTKFAMHLIRLLQEGYELIRTGNLEFPLIGRRMLNEIRNGSCSMADVIALADIIECDVEFLYKDSLLPNKPNWHVVESFVIETHRHYIK
jgi:hypothetical protein